MQRLLFNQRVNAMGNTTSAQNVVIFKGVEGTDWVDPILAPLDNNRISVKFDKTWTLKSGNQNGTVYERKLWHSMNKNLEYDDDEIGYQQGSNFYSVSSSQGMGDYYVLDIFSAGFGGSASDLLSINCTSTLYWHEK